MNNYEYGFITKCAEYNVDPEMLVKAASWFTNNNATRDARPGKSFAEKVQNMGESNFRRTLTSDSRPIVSQDLIEHARRSLFADPRPSRYDFRNPLMNYGSKEPLNKKNWQGLAEYKKRLQQRIDAVVPEARKRLEQFIPANQPLPVQSAQFN